MSFSDTLVNAGYRKTTPDPTQYSWAIAAFYKLIKDAKGVKYQIRGYQYPSNEARKESFMFKVQFETKTGDNFEVETIQWFFEENKWDHHVNTVESVEEFFEVAWKAYKCKHSELYN